MNCQHSPETQLGASQAFSSPGSGRYIHGSKPPTPLLLVLLFLSLTVLMPSLASARTYSLDDQIAFTYHTVTSDEDNVYFISASKPSGFYDTSKESYAVNYYVQPAQS